MIGAGGTAGHVVPALAVADALRSEGARVVFVGGERAERELIPAAGYEMHTLKVAQLAGASPWRPPARWVGRRRGGLARRLSAGCAGGGARRRRVRRGPVGLAAASRRVPLVLMEADSHLGLTNRLLAPLARRVCLTFPLPGRDGPRYLVTGRPVPAPATDREAARARFGIGAGEQCVLVFGGSQGARSINQAAIEAFAGARLPVLHAAGPGTCPISARPGPTTTCAATSTTSARRCWPATSWWPGQAGRSSRSPPTAAPWS